MEFILVQCLFEGPFLYYCKPVYEFQETIGGEPYNGYVGATKYIGTYYGSLVTIFGVVIAFTRMRDRIVRAKMTNMWYHATCRRKKMIKYDEFEKMVEQSQMNTFLKTSLNTELVITILKGIVILAASSSDNIDHMDDADMYRIKQVQTVEL